MEHKAALLGGRPACEGRPGSAKSAEFRASPEPQASSTHPNTRHSPALCTGTPCLRFPCRAWRGGPADKFCAAKVAVCVRMDEVGKQPPRNAFKEKHDRLRNLISWLSSSRFSTQAALARTLWPEKSNAAKLLAEYNTERRNGKRLDALELNSLHREISFRLKRAELPLEVPVPPSSIPTPTTPAAAPTPTPAPAPAPPRVSRPSALMVLDLKEVEGRNLGGHCLVMSLGTAAPEHDDRWVVSAHGQQLQLRHGYRARYTFSARYSAELGGRTFEFEIGTLDSAAELLHDGGPLWRAKEITGTVNDLISAQRIIIGRGQTRRGQHTGPSSPALLLRAIMAHVDLPGQRTCNALDLCGLTHPKVMEVLAIATAPPPPAPRPSHTIGSRASGLANLTKYGSQIRRIRALAGPAFVTAMESVSPDEPELVFQQLMKAPSFRNRFLTDFQRQVFSPAALRDRLLEEPFFHGMVHVYHSLEGWKAKRQHLALFAPYFPWSVTCKLFGVSQWLVYAARLHAGEFGAERPVPPSLVSFRLKHEQVQYLCDFVNRPELTQTLASSQGAGDWKCELKLRPEQLARKYQEVVPDHLRIGRSKVLEYLSQKCFRLARAKSCLCGLCEEHGWQNFEDLVDLIKEIGLGKRETEGFVTRARQLQDYLKTEYRRLCTTSLQVGCQRSATLCIPYALCGEGEFSCSCREKEHEMGFEQCNERFYLFADLREALLQRRQNLQAQLDALGAVSDSDEDEQEAVSDSDEDEQEDLDNAAAAAACQPSRLSPEAERVADLLAELDERDEELASCDNHADLYCRHLLRKALSSTITIEMLEALKANSKRIHLIVDYKQKILPEAHRETQTECFGKRGKSLHGCTAIRYDPKSEDYSVLNVRVACDDANQTWFHTLNTLTVSCDTITETWEDVTEASLQSDGAGNYDCTAFMLSLERLFSAAGLRLVRHTITEVGDGKNLQDTDFQQAQMSLNHGKDGGRSFADVQGIVDTLEETKTLGVVNLGMELGNRALEPKGKEGPKSYKGIDAMYDRVRRSHYHPDWCDHPSYFGHVHLPDSVSTFLIWYVRFPYLTMRCAAGVCVRGQDLCGGAVAQVLWAGGGAAGQSRCTAGLVAEALRCSGGEARCAEAEQREGGCCRAEGEALARAQPRALPSEAPACACARAARGGGDRAQARGGSKASGEEDDVRVRVCSPGLLPPSLSQQARRSDARAQLHVLGGGQVPAQHVLGEASLAHPVGSGGLAAGAAGALTAGSACGAAVAQPLHVGLVCSQGHSAGAAGAAVRAAAALFVRRASQRGGAEQRCTHSHHQACACGIAGGARWARAAAIPAEARAGGASWPPGASATGLGSPPTKSPHALH